MSIGVEISLKWHSAASDSLGYPVSSNHRIHTSYSCCNRACKRWTMGDDQGAFSPNNHPKAGTTSPADNLFRYNWGDKVFVAGLSQWYFDTIFKPDRLAQRVEPESLPCHTQTSTCWVCGIYSNIGNSFAKGDVRNNSVLEARFDQPPKLIEGSPRCRREQGMDEGRWMFRWLCLPPSRGWCCVLLLCSWPISLDFLLSNSAVRGAPARRWERIHRFVLYRVIIIRISRRPEHNSCSTRKEKKNLFSCFLKLFHYIWNGSIAI